MVDVTVMPLAIAKHGETRRKLIQMGVRTEIMQEVCLRVPYTTRLGVMRVQNVCSATQMNPRKGHRINAVVGRTPKGVPGYRFRRPLLLTVGLADPGTRRQDLCGPRILSRERPVQEGLL